MALGVLERLRSWNLSSTMALAVTISYAAALVFLFVRARLRYRTLPQLRKVSPLGQSVDCMVVIPARNEAQTIATAVRSFPPDTVIVVDDGSNDATAMEAEQAGAGVIRAPKLPKGAVGKAHACMVGARIIQSKWILFADADTQYASGFLDTVVAAAESNALSFVSVHLKQDLEGFASNLLVPYAEALLFAGVDPSQSPESVFRGQCFLVRREAYEFIGGHSASLTFFPEDVKLATIAQMHRMKPGLFRTEDLGRSKSHKGWKDLWHATARRSRRLNLLGGGAAAAAFIAAVLGVLWIPMTWLAYTSGWPLAAALVAVAPFAVLLPWYGNPRRMLLAPIAFYAILPMLLHALYCVWAPGRIQWKGRMV